MSRTGALRVLTLPGHGAEDVVVATAGPHEGAAFTGTEDGVIWRIGPGTDPTVERVAETGGRPLGVELDAADVAQGGEPGRRLVVADAGRGLLRVDTRTGAVEELADTVAGRRMKLVDNAAVARDGTVWFSDSSTRYDLARWKHDLVLDTRTGRLLRRDPDGVVHVALDGLAFANGVVLAEDESWVCVAETTARTIRRLHLTGPLAGRREVVVSDLPGYPDNLSLGSDGLLWVALASPHDPTVDRLHRLPELVRHLVLGIPERFQPGVKESVRVQAYDVGIGIGIGISGGADGAGTARLVHDLDLPPLEGFHMVTGVREHDGRVWLGSLARPAVAVVDL